MVIKIGEFLKGTTLKSIAHFKWIDDETESEENGIQLVFALNEYNTGFKVVESIHKQLANYEDYIKDKIYITYTAEYILVSIFNDAENIKFINENMDKE